MNNLNNRNNADNGNAPKTILLLSANPIDTDRLRFDEEIREIDEGLRRARYRDRFNIESRLAVRTRDIRRALLDYEPRIVHFIGHGEEDGLQVEDQTGNAVTLSPEALTGLFELFSDTIECVILNACDSAPQSEAINHYIPYVIGMRTKIMDKAAIEFSIGFYDALGAGKSVEDAFDFGCNAIHFLYPGFPAHLIPTLKIKST